MKIAHLLCVVKDDEKCIKYENTGEVESELMVACRRISSTMWARGFTSTSAPLGR